MLSNQTESIIEAVTQLRYFLGTAHLNWTSNQQLKRFQMPNGETISCVFWNNTFFITGTDIVRSLVFRFQAYGRPVKNMKKFEEGIFSDLRNLKPGVDAILEEPRSEFLEMLYKNNCIRTQKKQKVFYWFSVPHDRLFMDALERDHKRESEGKEPSTVTLQSPPLVEAMTMNPQTKIPSTLKHYSQVSQSMTPNTVMNQNNSYYMHTTRPQVQPINTSVNYSQNKTINMNYPMVQTQQQSPMIQNQIINNNNQVVQIVAQPLDSGNISPIYSGNQQHQPVYFNSTNQQQPIYSPTTAHTPQPMYTPTTSTTANSQQPIYAQTSASSQAIYSPASANPQSMYSPAPNSQQQMYSPNATTPQPQMYSPTSATNPQQQTLYSPNGNNWVNQQQQALYAATNVNTPPIYNSNSYVIASTQQQMIPSAQPNQMMPPTSMNGNQTNQMVSSVQPQYINQMPQMINTSSQVPVQQINSTNNNFTLNSQDGLDQSEIKSNSNQQSYRNSVTSTTTPSLIQTTIVYAPTSVAAIYSPSSSTTSIADGNNNEQIVFGSEPNDARDECNFVCDIKGCGRKFKRMEFLRRHQRCHSNDTSYGKEILTHRKSNSDEGMIRHSTTNSQVSMVKTPTYQSITNIQTTPNANNTSMGNNIITHMPSPPTTDIPYSNVLMKSECNPMYTPVSPNFNNVAQESNGTYYNQQFNNLNGYNQGTNTQNNNINSTTTTQQTTNTTLYTTPSESNQQSTSYQNIGLFQSLNEQMPSPPLQYQSSYSCQQNQPIYTTTSTPIY